jgi:hypothetical protein
MLPCQDNDILLGRLRSADRHIGYLSVRDSMGDSREVEFNIFPFAADLFGLGKEIDQFGIGVRRNEREEVSIVLIFETNLQSKSIVLAECHKIAILCNFGSIHSNFPTPAPSVPLRLLLLERKTSRFHALLHKSQIFSIVDDRKGIVDLSISVFDCEIKPFIVTVCVCVVLEEKHVVVSRGLVFVSVEEIAALEPRLEHQVLFSLLKIPVFKDGIVFSRVAYNSRQVHIVL